MPASALKACMEISRAHSRSATVKINDGSGAGYVNAPDGTTVSFTATSSKGANALPASGSCTTTGGSCNFMFSSATAGQVSLNPSTTLTLGRISLTHTPAVHLT